jgi:hypothetical protein
MNGFYTAWHDELQEEQKEEEDSNAIDIVPLF